MQVLRKMFLSRLKKFTNFKYDRLQSMAFDGEGFYVNHIAKVCKIDKNWGYDKHWAYGGVLLEKEFPLSCEMTDKEGKLGIFYCKLTYYSRNFKEFEYSLYREKLKYDEDLKCYYIIMTNLDFHIFNYMYKSDIQVIKKWYYKDIGYMSDEMKDFIKQCYKDKKACKKDKVIYEAGIYGMNAKTLYNKQNRGKDRIKYELAMAETQYKWVRNPQVPIATFQAAYLRYEECLQFIKYKDNVVYMNTDSIYLDKDLPHEDIDEIGKYGKEYDGMKIQYIRRNAYVVLNDDGSIYKTVVSSVVEKDEFIDDPITVEDLKKLANMESITKKSYKKKNLDGSHNKEDVIEITVSPKFKQDYLKYGGI